MYFVQSDKEALEMRIVVAIDSFKGSLSSLQAGNAVKEAVFKLLNCH